jgi:hypothetical protein
MGVASVVEYNRCTEFAEGDRDPVAEFSAGTGHYGNLPV